MCAFDSFKGSLSSRQAGEAARAGVLAAVPDAEVVVVPVADGGEGTIDALLGARRGREIPVRSIDALGADVDAVIALLDDGTAVVEAARVVGLALVGLVDSSVPPRASSAGLAPLLAAARSSGSSRVLVALGGTATTDGGSGVLAALTGTAVPAGNPLWGGPPPLEGRLPDLTDVEVLVDVAAPLLGPTGAARLFAAQKGADPAQVEHLESRMARWAATLAAQSGRAIADMPGAGAAGGIGAALLACGARAAPGFAVIADLVGLPEAIRGADLVLTGEGALDAQTALGKGPAGVAALARANGVAVVALAGRVDPSLGDGAGLFDAVLGIHARPLPPEQALDPAHAAQALARRAGEAASSALGSFDH